MKSFKEIIGQSLIEGGDMYPADEMTMKELKIACYASNNILERLEDGAMIQRWQISAIVKASEELASVYTSMSADMGDDDYEDEVVGYEYPWMGEEVKLEEATNKLVARYMNKNGSNVLYLEIYEKPNGNYTYTISNQRGINVSASAIDLRSSHADAKKNVERVTRFYDQDGDSGVLKFLNGLLPGWKKAQLNEEQDYKVSVEGLPDMYVKGKSPSEVKATLRKVVKKPDMVRSVDRVTQSMMKKIFRDKAAGKEDLDEAWNEELNEVYDAAYVRRAIPALKNAIEFHKDMMKIHDKKSVKGSPVYVRAHSSAAQAHKEAAERHRIAHAQLSAGTKDVAYYVEPARELGAYAEKLTDKAKMQKEEADLDEGISSLYHKMKAKSASRKAGAAFDSGNEDNFTKHMDKSTYHKLKAGQKAHGVQDKDKFMNYYKKTYGEEAELDEAKDNYTINHKTFSSAVQHAKTQVEKQGYTIDGDEWDRKVAIGPKKPGAGKTNRYAIELMKDGKPTKRMLQMQVYYDKGRYELNMYVS